MDFIKYILQLLILFKTSTKTTHFSEQCPITIFKTKRRYDEGRYQHINVEVFEVFQIFKNALTVETPSQIAIKVFY